VWLWLFVSDVWQISSAPSLCALFVKSEPVDMEGQCNAYYLMQHPLNNDGMELRDMESGAVDGGGEGCI